MRIENFREVCATGLSHGNGHGGPQTERLHQRRLQFDCAFHRFFALMERIFVSIRLNPTERSEFEGRVIFQKSDLSGKKQPLKEIVNGKGKNSCC